MSGGIGCINFITGSLGVNNQWKEDKGMREAVWA